MAAQSHALGRHVALVGFMGAGKTTLGAELAERLDRPFVDVDAEVEQVGGASIPELFATRGEAGSTGVPPPSWSRIATA